MNDGQLDLLLAGPFSAAGASLMLPRLMTGKHLGHPLVQTRPYRELHISCPQGVPVAADGEYLGVAGSLAVRCAPAELQIVAGTPQPAAT